jgi:hypothetical protein
VPADVKRLRHGRLGGWGALPVRPITILVLGAIQVAGRNRRKPHRAKE